MAGRAWAQRRLGRAMKNETSSREYTRNDFIRAGVVGAVWVVFYVLLAAYYGSGSSQGVKTAIATAPISVAGDAGTPRDAVHRLEGGPSGR